MRSRSASVLTLAAATLAALVAARRWRRTFGAVEVAGESMLPALRPGDWLLTRSGPPPRDRTAYGHVVTARDPGGLLTLKRVVGTPGEIVEFLDGEVRIDGGLLHEPYASGATLAGPATASFHLREDEYLLLGDHRPASIDGRNSGPTPRDQIEGVVWLRYRPLSHAGWLRPPRREFSRE